MEQTWINETMSLLEDMEGERLKLEVRLAETQHQIDELDCRINGAKALVQKYRAKYGVLPLPLENIHKGAFGNMTYPQILRLLASQNDGYLRVADAVDAIVKAGYSEDRKHIQPSIYSTLKRLRGQFTKVKPGEYRLVASNAATSIQQEIPKPQQIHLIEGKDEGFDLTKEDLPF